MQVIKLNATDSTNTYLKDLSVREDVPDFTVVHAMHQMAGRGQPGNEWISEKGKNLTFSVLKRFEGVPARRHFLLNILASLAVFDALQLLGIPDIRIKWPNDIMSGQKKICGILIENQVQGQEISRSIIGIGINVNQVEFKTLDHASSLKAITGTDFDIQDLLRSLLSLLRDYLGQTGAESYPNHLQAYSKHLYLKDKNATFYRPDGSSFEGFIRGVYPDGLLKIEWEGTLEAFGFKEVRYNY